MDKMETKQTSFIPYKLAFALKEKGFDEPCYSAYRNSDGEGSLMGLSSWTNTGKENTHEGYCAAPLYQEVRDWFQSKHNIWIEVETEFMYGTDLYVPRIKGGFTAIELEVEGEYYEAYDKAIEKALSLLIILEVQTK